MLLYLMGDEARGSTWSGSAHCGDEVHAERLAIRKPGVFVGLCGDEAVRWHCSSLVVRKCRVPSTDGPLTGEMKAGNAGIAGGSVWIGGKSLDTASIASHECSCSSSIVGSVIVVRGLCSLQGGNP